MPDIKLKPNSPEYDDGHAQTATQHCEMPGCAAEGDHKAPKHRGLNEYYHFCIEHVRDYNRAWNFFSGMADSEVQEHMHDSHYGFRPTWRPTQFYDADAKMEDNLRNKAWKNYHFTDKEPPHNNNGTSGPHMDAMSPEYEALSIMGLEPPVTLDKIKTRYKDLAKKHHPDLNRNDPESEELLKKINMSYTLLKLAYAQYEELPENKK